MSAELPSTVTTNAEHLRPLWPIGSPERHVINQIRELQLEAWTNARAKSYILGGMVLALELLALQKEGKG